MNWLYLIPEGNYVWYSNITQVCSVWRCNVDIGTKCCWSLTVGLVQWFILTGQHASRLIYMFSVCVYSRKKWLSVQYQYWDQWSYCCCCGWTVYDIIDATLVFGVLILLTGLYVYFEVWKFKFWRIYLKPSNEMTFVTCHRVCMMFKFLTQVFSLYE